MTSIRYFFLSLLCFSAFSTLTVQAQKTTTISKFVPNQVILRYPPGTTTSQVENDFKKNGLLSFNIKGSAVDLGLFLVESSPKYLNTSNPCGVVIVQGVCNPCAISSGGGPTGGQGGGLNYYTENDATFNTKSQSEAWASKWNPIISAGGKGCPITVAFSDSGIDKQHLGETPWFAQTSAATISNYTSPYDENGHGTHVIGITAQIVKNYSGIKLLSIKTQDMYGQGTIWGAIEAIQTAIEKKATIFNMSLAYWPSCNNGVEPVLKTAMRIAGERNNMLFVTAAGNNNRLLESPREIISVLQNEKKSIKPQRPFYVFPSMYNLDNQINVAALGDNNQLASFTNYGVNYVNIGTDGVNIYSAGLDKKYASASGTSMATPHITAVTAILSSLTCNQNYAELRKCILDAAITNELPLSTYGYLEPSAAISCKKARGRTEENSEEELAINTDNDSYKIYPNPFYEALNLEITTKNENEITQCTLYNFTGQIIQKINYQGNINTNWNVQDLPKGVYLLKIQHNGTQEVQKLIKQ